MRFPQRLTRMIYIPSRDLLVGADVAGKLHAFDRDLNLLQSSPDIGYSVPINAITSDAEYVYTRNRRGSIAKWKLPELEPLDVYDDLLLKDDAELWPDEVPSPAANRGIGVLNGRLYANNGFLQVVVLDTQTFNIIAIRPALSQEAFIDCINTELPMFQAVSQTDGTVFLGDLATNEFPVQIKIDGNNVHWVKHDGRHNRFWATQDAGLDSEKNIRNGVVTFDYNGQDIRSFPFTKDDVEFLEFNEDYTRAFVGGFDAHVYVFNNEERALRLHKVLGPLPYQIINACYIGSGELAVLLQNGEIYRITIDGRILGSSEFAARCVWAIEPQPGVPNTFYCATDQGIQIISCSTTSYKSVDIEKRASHAHAFGIVRRVQPLTDGSYLAIAQSRTIFRANSHGDLDWHRRLLGVPRSLSLSDDQTRALVSTDAGEAFEIDVNTGDTVHDYSTDQPVWLATFGPQSQRVFGTKNGELHVWSDRWDPIGKITLPNYVKRSIRHEDKLFVVGAFGLIEVDLEELSLKKEWGELLVNTKENATIIDGYVHVCCYGYQMGSYRYEDSEMVYLLEDFRDFPKGLASFRGKDGAPILLVGGRGGYLSAYRTENGIPQKVRTVYL